MERRAISHVEMMISFIMFVLFVLFFFIFFSPFKKTTISESLLDIAELGIRKNTTASFITTTLSINKSAYDDIPNSGMGSCFRVKNISEKNVIVKNEDGDIVPSGVFKHGGEYWLFISKSGSGRFYYIYYSEKISPPSFAGVFAPGQCVELDESNYSFGITKTREIITLEELERLNKTYWQSYESLKKQFHFPKESDFGFVVKNETDGIIFYSLRRRLSGLDVIVREQPIEVINKTSAVIYGKINIFAW